VRGSLALAVSGTTQCCNGVLGNSRQVRQRPLSIACCSPGHLLAKYEVVDEGSLCSMLQEGGSLTAPEPAAAANNVMAGSGRGRQKARRAHGKAKGKAAAELSTSTGGQGRRAGSVAARARFRAATAGPAASTGSQGCGWCCCRRPESCS